MKMKKHETLSIIITCSSLTIEQSYSWRESQPADLVRTEILYVFINYSFLSPSLFSEYVQPKRNKKWLTVRNDLQHL